jgi:small subunit ribosomal protein S4
VRRRVEKLSRRLGVDLELKGLRSLRGKSALQRRPYPPGQHGRRHRRGGSAYLRQLEEKQKVRFLYGVGERQLQSVFRRSVRSAEPTGLALVRLLESRLDNVIYRLGLAATRAQARQLVSHRHVLVDGGVVDIASYEMRPGAEVQVRPSSRARPLVIEALDAGREPAPWMSLDRELLTGRILRQPDREEVQVPFDERQLIEFYSR